MPSSAAKAVSSNQSEVHTDLLEVVRAHRESQWQKPTPGHTEAAARDAIAWIRTRNKPVILDSFCGTGMSTATLAAQFPNHSVCGIDQSAHRLEKHQPAGFDNYRLFRAECETFWRELNDAQIAIDKHYLLYPNPWPKKHQLKRRVHGHPSFPLLGKLGGDLEMRTNWKLYAQEFAMAASSLGFVGKMERLVVDNPLTLFERKYNQAGQPLWRYRGQVAD